MTGFVQNINSGNPDYLQALQQNSDPGKAAPTNGMDQSDFLLLLTTQMQNQDPSKPMDPTNFVTDLTQMSQLEATNNMNSSMLAMAESFKNLQTMQGASLIGKNVQVTGEDFSHTQGQVSNFELSSDQPLTGVTVVISDGNGVVEELNLADMQTGNKIVEWNGLDNVDVERGSGVYSLTAFGTDANGEVKSLNTVVASRVNSVGINGDGTMTLTLATGEKVAMDTVREISG